MKSCPMTMTMTMYLTLHSPKTTMTGMLLHSPKTTMTMLLR